MRDVKNAHQIQETGEFYVFNDDVDYILDTLSDNNPIATRCLSAISLASKCMIPAFRMHVRAHGIVAKFFGCLHDATSDPVSHLTRQFCTSSYSLDTFHFTEFGPVHGHSYVCHEPRSTEHGPGQGKLGADAEPAGHWRKPHECAGHSNAAGYKLFSVREKQAESPGGVRRDQKQGPRKAS